jgi:uncharacterized membrane protein YbhN (UPF0104 family)
MHSVSLPIADPPAAPALGGIEALASRPSVQDWARRLRVPAFILLAVVFVAVLVGGPAEAFLDALRRAITADPRWVAAAAAFEILSFTGYIALLWHVAGRDAPRFGLRESYRTTLAGAAATRLLPTAGAGGAALTLWTLQKSGHRGRAGARTLLTFLVVLYAVFLGAILFAGASAAATGTGPFALGAIPAALAGLAIVAALVLGLRARRGAAAEPREGGRLARVRDAAGVMGEAVRDAVRLVRAGDPRLLGAFAWWGFDILVLWATFNAVGAPPALSVLVLGYFLGQVANTIPVPGAASGGLVGVLIAFGVEADLALAAVMAYRAIAIWLPAPAGAHALAGLRRSAARWAQEDAEGDGSPSPAPTHTPAPAAARPRVPRLVLVHPPLQGSPALRPACTAEAVAA